MSIDIPLHKNSLFQPPFDKRNDIIRRQTSYLQTIKLRFFTSDDLSLSSAIFHIWILIMTQSFNLLQSDSNGSVVFFVFCIQLLFFKRLMWWHEICCIEVDVTAQLSDSWKTFHGNRIIRFLIASERFLKNRKIRDLHLSPETYNEIWRYLWI